jgi:NAD(P)-dependent dehydrogenase (short-subunit alcohol dehydrogenase family)
MNYKSKVTIVTGAGRGIGKHVAQAYAREGARVVLAEKDAELGMQAERAITEAGGEAVFFQTDVGDPGDVGQTAARTFEKYGRIDILINNAGVSRWKSPYELTVEEWDEILNTNLRGAFLFSREAARFMRRHGGGAIVNIASTRALMSEPNSEAYAASKGGILALTHALAASFSKDRIQVNCISPGWIETGDYEKLSETDHSQHLSQRVGKPDDIARACMFLTGEGNDFISGTNIVIDGGMTVKMIYND